MVRVNTRTIPFLTVVLILIVLVVLAVVLIVLVLVVVLVAVLILILVLVLVVHEFYLLFFYGLAATVVCPNVQDLSLARKIRLTSRPAVIAAVIPPAVDFKPPVNMPIKPFWFTASLTPLARE